MSAPIVTAGTLLGENAVGVLAALVAHLRRTTGLDLRFMNGGGTRSSDDAGVWRHDLVWACGLIGMRAIEAARDDSGTRAAVGTDAVRSDADIVAAPVFAGETAACYRSLVVARRGGALRSIADVARCRVAINETASWSGCQGLLAHLATAGHAAHFASVAITGSHRRSVEAVAAGRAEAAAIDETVWRHLTAIEPALCGRLFVVDRTADWPAPPFVLRRSLGRPLRERLTAGLVAVREGDVPGLARVEACGEERYRWLLASTAEQIGHTRALLALAGGAAPAPDPSSG